MSRFCPFAQRAWIVANMLPEGSITVVNDHRSMVADTDDAGIYRDSTDSIHHYDNIARYMLKGELLGDRSVPTMLTPGGPDQTGDSISIARTLWESEDSTLSPALCTDAIESTAREWSDKMMGPFYNSLGNKDGKAQEFFDLLLENMSFFGASIEGGPFFGGGSNPSLVDVIVYPVVFRIVTQKLFHTYRSEELTESSLALLDLVLGIVTSPTDTSGTTDAAPATQSHRHQNLLQVGRWLSHCHLVPAFVHTLPADVDTNAHFYSPRLVELYRIYAMGIGLKGLFSGKITTLNVHNVP